MLQFFKIEDPNIKILDFSTTVVDGEIRNDWSGWGESLALAPA